MPAVPPEPPAGVALFDLDGTLIAWDCQLLFRHFVVRREPWRIVFLPLFLVALPLTPILGAGGMKRIFLSYLCGMDAETLDRLSRDFAASLMPAIYPELRERLENHRRAGHLTVLVSASPEFYVRHIGRELGFDLTLGTPVETGNRCPLIPDLENNKGREKVRRLREVLPASYFGAGRIPRSHGYTDSPADLPMLELCERVTLVNPLAPLAALHDGERTDILRPVRPWRNKAGFIARALALLFGIGKDPGGIRLSGGA